MCSLPSGSESFSSMLMVTGVVPSVSVQSSLAIGRLTCTVTVAGLDAIPRLSLTVYWNVSQPVKAGSAVYVISPETGSTTAVPWWGAPTTARVLGTADALSLTSTATATGVPPSVSAQSSLATGPPITTD